MALDRSKTSTRESTAQNPETDSKLADLANQMDKKENSDKQKTI